MASCQPMPSPSTTTFPHKAAECQSTAINLPVMPMDQDANANCSESGESAAHFALYLLPLLGTWNSALGTDFCPFAFVAFVDFPLNRSAKMAKLSKIRRLIMTTFATFMTFKRSNPFNLLR